MDKKFMIEAPYKNESVQINGLVKDFIWFDKTSLSKDFCAKVIEKFNADPEIHDGVCGEDKRVQKDHKRTKAINMSRFANWKEEDDVFYKSLIKGLKEYGQYLGTIHPLASPIRGHKVRDTGYLMQRYEPGGFFDWHNDWSMGPSGARIYTFLWYLNTLEIEDAGYTEFADGTRVQPEAGMLMVFPATWTYMHRGFPPKVKKYICTGWISAQP